jgi:hypothetical protein
MGHCAEWKQFVDRAVVSVGRSLVGRSLVGRSLVGTELPISVADNVIE